jgi:hypothetical protein
MRRETLLAGIGLAVLATILTIAFRAYLHPDMLLEFATFILCL